MTQPVASQMASPQLAEGPGEALADVVQGATALVRAELRLAVAEAKVSLFSVMRGLALLWLSLLLLQVVVLLVALAPLLADSHGWPRLVVMLLLAAAPAAGALWLLAREARRLKELLDGNRAPTAQ